MTLGHLSPAQARRVQALAQAFEHIGRTRLHGVPVQNPQLGVQAIGFETLPGQPSAPEVLAGILLTPWFMNLVRLPVLPDAAGQAWLAPGRKARRALGCERFEFMGAFEEGIGVFEVCSLFSPMFEFANQKAAVATATQVLALLRAPVADPAVSAQASASSAENAGNAGNTQTPSRRSFLFGRAGAGA